MSVEDKKKEQASPIPESVSKAKLAILKDLGADTETLGGIRTNAEADELRDYLMSKSKKERENAEDPKLKLNANMGHAPAPVPAPSDTSKIYNELSVDAEDLFVSNSLKKAIKNGGKWEPRSRLLTDPNGGVF